MKDLLIKRKLTQVFTYLSIKDIYKFEEKAGKMIWLADKRSLIAYMRTITYREFPSAILPPDLKVNYETNPTYGPFSELSRSDMKELDRVFLLFENLDDEQIAGFQTQEYTSFEEVFAGEDPERSQEMISVIRENGAIRQSVAQFMPEDDRESLRKIFGESMDDDEY